jgi:NitT/TauT family transport system substrate-binding protein
MDPREVRIVNMTPDKAVASLLKGEVDAVSTWSPHTSLLRDKLGDNALVLGDPGLYTMMWNLAAAPDYIKNNPERVRKLLRAIIRANRFITNSPGEARVASRQYIGTESPLLEKEWGNYRFLTILDQSLILNMEDQARWMDKREGMRYRRPNFLDIIYTEGLNTVKPDAVRIAGK